MGRPRCTPPGAPMELEGALLGGGVAGRGGGAGAVYTGRGPVCGITTRRTGIAGASGTGGIATAISGSGAGAGGGATTTAGGAATAAGGSGATGGRATTTGAVGALDAMAGRGAGAAPTGGRPTTGPDGALDAIAGGAMICGAWRGKGTMRRGAGRSPLRRSARGSEGETDGRAGIAGRDCTPPGVPVCGEAAATGGCGCAGIAGAAAASVAAEDAAGAGGAVTEAVGAAGLAIVGACTAAAGALVTGTAGTAGRTAETAPCAGVAGAKGRLATGGAATTGRGDGGAAATAGRCGAGAAWRSCSARSTSPGLDTRDRSMLGRFSGSRRAPEPPRSLPPRVSAPRTRSASSPSSELECVLFSVTPTAVSTSRMALLFTSSSRARSLIRTLLIRPFICHSRLHAH